MSKLLSKFSLSGALLTIFVVSGMGHAQVSTDIANLRSQNSDLVWAYDRVQLPAAWNKAAGALTGSTDVIIGVVDTGVDTEHPEFPGFDFGSFPDDLLRDYCVIPEVCEGGHGTQVAGIIGADNKSATTGLPGNSPEMNGVLSGAQGTGYQIIGRPGTSPFSEQETFENLGAIILSSRVLAVSEGAISEDGAEIINWSVGSSKCFSAVPGVRCFPDSDVDAIRHDWQEFIDLHPDVTFAASAGNAGTNAVDTIPAGLIADNLIVVGGMNKLDERVFFVVGSSNFGNTVHIAAPGEFVYAPAPENSGNYVGSVDYTTTFNGTSAAAPFVTGVAGLMKALEEGYQNAQPGFNLTPALIKETLIKSADVLTTTNPAEQGRGLGPVGGTEGCHYVNDVYQTTPTNGRGCRLNAHRAVVWWLPPTASNVTSATRQ